MYYAHVIVSGEIEQWMVLLLGLYYNGYIFSSENGTATINSSTIELDTAVVDNISWCCFIASQLPSPRSNSIGFHMVVPAMSLAIPCPQQTITAGWW